MTHNKCLFCNIDSDRVILENDFVNAIYDAYLVTQCHALIIPKRHIETYFELTNEELLASINIIKKLKEDIQMKDDRINGFNIGANNGESAGHTIFHCHIHLIPRRTGDVDNPRGGIRHLIPGKGYY